MSRILPPELIKAISSAINADPNDLFNIEVVGGGLINQSFKLTNEGKSRSYFLQSINTSIFSDPEKIQDNYLVIYNYLKNTSISLNIPSPVFFDNKTLLFYDNEKRPWRMFDWVLNSKTMATVATEDEAKEVATTFALFTLSLNKGFDTALLQQTLPGFHDLSLRYNQFINSVENAIPGRKRSSLTLIEELQNRENLRLLYKKISSDKNDFPLRVMHHDAKISNILFNAETGKVWGPVDLDTVMPGYFFSDLGDMIRSFVSSAPETETDFSRVYLRKEYYKAIVDNYSSVMENDFTGNEKQYIHAAGLIMIYMQALRFLTDHLNGDIYYQVAYPEQNFHRALNQLSLLKKLEEYLYRDYGFVLK